MNKAITAVFLISGLGLGCGKTEPVIKIGFVCPLTGDQAAHGTDMLHGAELAMEEAKSAPVIEGYKLELMALDDQRSPAQAVAMAKKIVSDPSVVAVVGHLNSSCTKPASAIYNKAGLLHINPVSSNPEISRQGFNNFFRICATDDLQGPAGAHFAKERLEARRVFIIDDMTTYGRGLANEFEKAANAMGMEILGHEGIAQGEKDFTPLLTRIKGTSCDLIYYAGMFPEAAVLIKQKSDLQIPARFIGGDGLYEPTLITLATPPAAEGVYLTTLGADLHTVPTAQSFVKAYQERYGRHLGAYSGYAYEGVSLAIEAIRRSGKADRAAVLAAMKNLSSYPGILGNHTFDSKGDTAVRSIGIFTIRGGKFQFLESVE
ncbi:MAG: branched-chain amino acid ABC transporter substrate-binding protein [Candidatus Omnitrophica bacterium]|nr:branched-chain amino acid ABC transporter substrate-binding protein [Candidatus Omnitrophota bacterium]